MRGNYYDSELYPKYDNYDAIEVAHVADLPCDYDGVMGVPITFMAVYNPKQFEIIGLTDRDNRYGLTKKVYTKDDTPKFGDFNRRATIKLPNGSLKSTFARLLIRRKEQPNED